MHHSEQDLLSDEARSKAHKRPKIDPPIDGAGAADHATLTPDTWRAELKYLRKKRKFIAAGNYLPATTLAYQRACNRSYRNIVAIQGDEARVLLQCGDWIDVPPAAPLTQGIGESRFCGRCADALYRTAMLKEIDENIKATQRLLAPPNRLLSPLAAFIVIVLLAGLVLAAIGIVRGNPRPVGSFDPRSDASAEGQCP